MDLRTQLQEHLGDGFRIERELGGGGMSRVFQATELRLSRQVVIKVLSPELAQGLNADRFEREILMAASLQQANIVPVLSAGDMNGLPWFTMPYVDGESLRNRIGNGMPLDDVVTILRDVTKALAYAHQRGIVHRDIKPDNVLLSGGTAVVTDFGIAKALSASRTDGSGHATLTSVGTSIGTPAYMAPEQVAGDPHLDHRVDLYSLGCMAFEMLTGKPPFADMPPQRMLGAHLTATPAPVESLRPDCPPSLALLVARLLQKDPADRPADAASVLTSLGAVSTTSSESTRLSPQGRLIRSLAIWAVSTLGVWILARAAVVGIGLPSWTVPGAVGVMLVGLPVLLATGWAKWMARRAASATPTLTPGGTAAPRLPSGTMATIAIKANRHLSFRRATRGGIYAMGAFILLIAGFMVTRAMGIGPAASLFAAGTLRSQDHILLADFTTGAGDSALAPIIHEAARAAMSQSTAVRLLDASDVARTLSQMQRPDTTKIQGEVARELAQRAGAKAILGGRLVRGTDGYFLSVELTDAETGSVLASVQERAKGDDELLGSVDRAAKEVRSKIGESLRQVQHAVPLAQATTASLPALRLYTEAVHANNVEGDLAGAERDLREALKLDSTFALAWRKLAVTLFNQERSQASIDSALEQGFRYADRLPPVERNLIKGFYYERHSSRADRSKALEAYRAVLAVDSLNLTALSQMGFEHYFRGDYDSAAVYAARKLRLDTTITNSRVGLAEALSAAGRSGDARKVLAGINASALTIGDRYFLLQAQFDLGETSSVERAADSLSTTTDPFWRAAMLESLSQLQAFGGKHAKAISALEQASSAWQQLGQRSLFEREQLFAAGTEISLGDTRGGVARLNRRLATPAWQGTAASLTNYAQAAYLLAIAGAESDARALMARARAAWPEAAKHGFSSDWVQAADGEAALAGGNANEAMARFRDASVADDGGESEANAWAQFGLARSYDALGQADSAIAALERYLAIPRYKRLFNSADPFFAATVQKRLGELYDAKHDKTRALEHYGAFVEQWKDADANLQPAVQHVRERMAELTTGEGS